MDKKFFIPLGVLFFFVGTALILNSVSGITGLAVVENVDSLSGSAIGVVLIVLGIFSFAIGAKHYSKNRLSIFVTRDVFHPEISALNLDAF